MKKSLLLSTLIAATALTTTAWATDYTFSKDSIPSADGITAGGDGSADTPYYITECGSSDRISISTDIFTDTGTTVYLGTENLSFGAAGVNSFFSGSFTAACNIVIGSAGVYLTNGGSGQYYNFTGTISGDGSLTVGYYGTGNNQGSTVAQHYAFTGDLSGWTGDITITTSNSYDYLIFGGTITGANSNTGDVTGISATQAATNESVSGTGAISVDHGSVEYVYTAGANGETGETLTVTNSSIEAHTIIFTGGVNYDVSAELKGWDGSSSSGGDTTTNSTLTISTTGTVTVSGKVSNFDNVTVASGATLAVGSTGSLDLSGATVDLASAIQNSGTVTINTSTVFVLDNLSYTGTLTEGATYTLITNIDSGSVTISGTLGLDNVSSVHEITSATFNYADGVLTVTVIELEDGLHGDGTSSNPYYTSGSGTLVLPTTGEGGIFAGDSSTTVYIATEDHSLGTADENVYWASGSFTAACNIVIGKAGIYLDNGFSGQTHTFTGAISGEGSWTINSSGVNQDYIFTGDLSDWSGDFTITGSSASYVCYGDGKTVAATATNVTGTGAISVANGTVAFDYIKEDESGNKGPETVTIGNSSITAGTLEFMGDVAYSVDLSKTTLSATTLNVGESATLLISGSGTLTESSSSSSIAVSGTLELASNVTLTITKNSHASTSVENLVLVNGSTLVQNANTANSSGTTDGQPVSKEEGLSIGTLTITSSDTSSTTGPSATIQNSTWHNYVGIGALVGTNATLTLTSDAASSVTNIYELGTSGNTSSESQFTGKISLSDTNTSSGRGVTLVISEEKIAAGAVIEMGAEVDKDTLALGVNAERVEIAGLVSGGSGNNGGDVVYSGEVSVGAALGDNGATLIDYKSQSGYGEGSKFDNVGTSRNTLVINTAEGAEYSFSGVVMDMLNLEKTGAGTQSIEFKSSTYGTSGFYFDGTITVTEGTLSLSGVETNSAGITVAEGATLNISNHITLAATSDIESVSSTISGTLNIAEGGQLDLAGTVNINSAISNSGTITIADGASIVVGVTMQTGEYSGTNYDYYELISGSGSGTVELGSNVTFVIDGAEITLSEIATLADGDTDWKGYVSGGSLFIYAETSTTAETADPLYWAGTEDNNTWSTQSSDIPWSATDGGSSGYYFSEGASVTFGPNTDGSLSTTIVLGENITAGTVNITGSGYTLTAGAGSTLTATSIVLDDEDSADTHTFTIGDGVKVQAGSMTEKAGQLDLVVNGELEVTTMTVTTTQDESISGSGKLTVGTFEYSSDHGVSLTISVAEATFGSITEQSSGTENSGDLRHLIFGDGTSTTTASVTSMEIKGLSEVQVAKDSTLTITELVDSSGWNTTISGDGSIKIGSMTVSGSSTNGSSMLTISIANFESGAITFSGTNSLTISSASFKADSIVFTGGNDGNSSGAGGITISSGANAIVGLIQSDKTHTLTIADGGELTAGEIYRSGNTLNLAVNGTLTVAQLEGYADSTGMIYFGKSGDGATSMAQTLSGSGTANVYGIGANIGTGSLTISVANLNIGAGGITRYGSGNGTITINGTKVGLYSTDASTISADVTIGTSGVTFNPENEGETITLSGAITGNGLVTKTGEGELVFTGTGSSLSSGLTVSAGTVSVAEGASLSLGGTVTLASAISNSGSITIAEGTSFVINGITMGTTSEGNDYYVVITGGDGGSISGTIEISSFSGVELDGTWSVYTDNGYLVIYGEAQTVEGQSGNPLVWDGTEDNHTWNSGDSSNAIWQNESGDSGYYFTNGNDVTFGATDAYTTVAVESENAITAGSITVNSAYTFDIGDGASVTTGALTYGNDGSLTLTGSGTFVFNGEATTTDFTISTSDEFTGTLEVAKGLLDLSKVSLGTSTKLVIDAIGNPDDGNGAYTTSSSNAILFDANNTTLANDLTIAGSSGGVILRSAGQEITLSGSVTGDEGTTLQLNGSGTANFTGTVSLDKYINYQGTSVFKNATTLGTLDIYQTGSDAGAVTFTGSDAQATVTDLTVHATTGSGTATLTVSDGASLSVGTMEVNHDFAITIDKAAMSITGTVTQTAGTTTSVTISNGGQLSLGDSVSLNVDVMNIVLGTANYDENGAGSGTYAIVGGSDSSLTLTDSAAITITVDSALESLLSSEGTYYFDISKGIVLTEDNLDWSALTSYGTVSYSDGIISVVVGTAIPEPGMFSLFFSVGALGLVATRRRRKAA